MSEATVKNCFKKAGFWIGVNREVLEPKDSEVGLTDGEWAKVVSEDVNGSTNTVEDHVQIDEDVDTSGEQTDEDIIENCVNTFTERNESDDEDEPDLTMDMNPEIIPKKHKALNALESIHKFFDFSTVIDEGIFDKIYDLEKLVQKSSTDCKYCNL